ncbi:MAG TPA: hypothetical protein DHR80_12950, partial [Thalassospira lucentensis]|nr:hypothetical protein [Thalassospira lucentensis]
GILSMCIVRQADGMRNRNAALAAIVTGCFISSYSLVDGTGARLAGSALDYYAYQTVGDVLIFGLIATVMWAFTHAPIPLVVALRETGIVFALFIGVFFMGEKLNLVKVSSTMMTLGGAIILRLSKSL